MAVAEAQKKTKTLTHAQLVAGVKNGSSYCALALAKRIRAMNVDEIILEIGGLPNGREELVFNAAADGFSVFDDARSRDLL